MEFMYSMFCGIVGITLVAALVLHKNKPPNQPKKTRRCLYTTYYMFNEVVAMGLEPCKVPCTKHPGFTCYRGYRPMLGCYESRKEKNDG